MIRTAHLSRRLAVVLAVALLALAAGPAAAAVAGALGPDCCEHSCPLSASDAPTCCAQSPAVPHDSATLQILPVHDWVPVGHESVAVAALTVPQAQVTPSRDTGPPHGPRRHLILSVFLV